MNLIDQAFERAKDVLRMNVTERGFSACSITHDADERSNYRSVWARDSAMTLTWVLPLHDPTLTDCARASLETILSAQTVDGHIPNYVDVVTGRPEYGGFGNIGGIDAALWIVISAWNYLKVTNDLAFAERNYSPLDRAMTWLRAHDSNNCGLLEIPEASDWTDLFPRSYNVLYDEVLWYRANVAFASLLQFLGRPADAYINRAARVRTLINQLFWPSPEGLVGEGFESMSRTQFGLIRTRYLIAQITPFGFSWRCDVFANIIASLYGVLNHDRAESVRRFMQQVGVDRPFPARVLYPAIRPGEPDWRDYFLVNLLNLPDHYHNGGIWPFVGGLWVRFLLRLGHTHHAEDALTRLAMVCRDGIDHEWEFTEWAHGQTGRAMGKSYQAWSAAAYISAYLRFHGDQSIEVSETLPEELTLGREAGVHPAVTAGKVDLDVRPAGETEEKGTAAS